MITAFTRCGLKAEIQRIPSDACMAPWFWLGDLHHPAGPTTKELWCTTGRWRDDGAEHPLDLIQLNTTAAALAAEKEEKAS